MKVHHTGHHQAYTDNLNKALVALKDLAPELAAKPLGELLQALPACPEKVRGALRNAGGGYVNHLQFFTLWMAPPGLPGVGPAPPAGALADAIGATFGSLDKFKEDFSAAAAAVFGSGWAWLIVDKTGGAPVLRVVPTINQETPAMEAGKVPILGLDVWEHAYCEARGAACGVCGVRRARARARLTAPRPPPPRAQTSSTRTSAPRTSTRGGTSSTGPPSRSCTRRPSPRKDSVPPCQRGVVS